MKLLRQGGILCFAFLVSACASTQGRSESEELPTALPIIDLYRFYRGPGGSESEELLTAQAWEPARLERMRLAAKEAWKRGGTAEAEQLCVEVLQYVGTSTVKSLYGYAALLKALKREGAEAAHARADKLLEARSRPGPGSVYLGFAPSDELKRYADLLQELAQGAEAEAMQALASAEDHAQKAHFFRLRAQYGGRKPPLIC